MKRSKKKLKKRPLIISLVILVLLLGSGVTAKVLYDNKVAHDKQVAYAKLKESVASAEDKAYQTRKEEDIKNSRALIEQLDKEDRDTNNKKIDQLQAFLSAISEASKAVSLYQAGKTDAQYKTAETLVNKLTDDYEKADQTKLKNQLATIKKQVDAKKAADAEAERLKNQKLVALTFDDGPSPSLTPQLLNTLKANNVHATFFSLGQNAQRYPDVVKAASDAGNEVASHTWDHKNLVTLSPEAQKQEIMSAHDTINKITGKNVNLFRPPYGSYNATTLAQTPLAAVNWSIDTNDWRYVGDSATVVKNAVSAAHDGGIILLHDIHSWSVAAVPQIIQQLKAQGYTFVTVTELLEAKYGAVQGGKVYTGY